ncbi:MULTISPECIES: transglycosylase SLT domain-containing protein [unclassified Bradyrhizobium]|uniref:lytic transglycosylase domain-containing protein n=1 Tax=unclassified Bradyrhizobium TaxID=2631580 RepID=UPI001FFA4FC5|nr:MULTISPECIES: transglycosylase SLT domain-containing protein [unclassified Bradyrhizobium]MCK1709618.1 transglycosylase SLT domain-containing protein [Bradyrhizobium sp. 143]MCK1730478.1 transglycosylase SLT domain-containing protein [Bradyrhizobium sp. 142]
MLWDPARLSLDATWRHVAVVVLWLASMCVHAEDQPPNDAETTSTIASHDGAFGAGETPTSRAAIRNIIERETAKTDLPADIAEAVVFVESGYNPTVIGSAGEIGLMQVRPETAAMLGFRGNGAELAEPAINIHYGVLYLSRAWRLAGGDLCRALMKYRAGHGEESTTPRSQIYCNRARNRLLAMNSAVGRAEAVAIPASAPTAVAVAPATKSARNQKAETKPKDVYARYRHGTTAASRAYWAAHEARIGLIKARIEARWKRVASR